MVVKVRNIFYDANTSEEKEVVNVFDERYPAQTFVIDDIIYKYGGLDKVKTIEEKGIEHEVTIVKDLETSEILATYIIDEYCYEDE